jgi:hypothetical protein
MNDAGRGKPPGGQGIHTVPVEATPLTTASKRAIPALGNGSPEGICQWRSNSPHMWQSKFPQASRRWHFFGCLKQLKARKHDHGDDDHDLDLNDDLEIHCPLL